MFRRLRGIRREAGYAHVVIGAQGRVTQWDQAAADLFGWQATEVLGSDLTDFLVPSRYGEAHKAGLARVLADRPSRILGKEIHTVAETKAGREINIRMLVNRLAGRNGNAYFVASIAPADVEFIVLGPGGAIASPAAMEKESMRKRQEEMLELLADATAELIGRRDR